MLIGLHRFIYSQNFFFIELAIYSTGRSTAEKAQLLPALSALLWGSDESWGTVSIASYKDLNPTPVPTFWPSLIPWSS